MKSILEQTARLCLPALMLCALGARGALAEATPPEGKGTEWPQTTSTPEEEAPLSQSMPEEFTSTEAYREGGRDSLSLTMPKDTTALDPSVTRLRAPQGWREDGSIVKAHFSKTLPGAGDLAYGRMRKGVAVQVGDRLYVLRRDAAVEADADPDAIYLERIAEMEVQEVLSKRQVRLRVLKISSELAPGDLLSLKAL